MDDDTSSLRTWRAQGLSTAIGLLDSQFFAEDEFSGIRADRHGFAGSNARWSKADGVGGLRGAWTTEDVCGHHDRRPSNYHFQVDWAIMWCLAIGSRI